MIDEGIIRGVTSNPSIFITAISNSNDYDGELETHTGTGLTAERIYESLAAMDIQQACDLFLTLYEKTEGGDGYVSLEVNPKLVYITDGTIKDAKCLWTMVKRPN